MDRNYSVVIGGRTSAEDSERSGNGGNTPRKGSAKGGRPSGRCGSRTPVREFLPSELNPSEGLCAKVSCIHTISTVLTHLGDLSESNLHFVFITPVLGLTVRDPGLDI